MRILLLMLDLCGMFAVALVAVPLAALMDWRYLAV